jgi:hypothetical protein
LEAEITGHNFGRGPSKDHSTKIWSKLAQWFLRKRLKCEKFTTYDRRKTKNKVFNKSNTHVEGADLGYFGSLWTAFIGMSSINLFSSPGVYLIC